MIRNQVVRILSIIVVFFLFTALVGDSAAVAGRYGGGGSRGSSSFGKGSSWSSSTRGTWNRSGGGIFGGGQSSSGYSKPSAKPSTPSSSPYSKPSSETSSGYSKPGFNREAAPSSGSGYSKPSLPGQGSAESRGAGPGNKSSSGYTKPSAATAPGAGFSGGSKFDKTTIQEQRRKSSQESLKTYQAEQAKFKEPVYKGDQSKYESNPLYQKGKVYSGFDYKSHYGNRDNYYKAQGYQPPPYAFNTAPSFGMFDTIFLFWMLDHLRDKGVAATAYNHADDPGYKKWRQEADTLAKDNSDLKAKLNDLDTQVKSMAGTPKDPGYLPKGVPPDVALAAAALATKKPENPPLKLATGQEGGWYYKFGKIFKKDAAGINVQLIPSSGSLETLKMLTGGQADLGIVQSDALALLEKKLPGKKLVSEQTSLFLEYAQLIANKDSGVKSIKDLDPKKNIIYVGPSGSGTAITWEALSEQNSLYRGIPIVNSDYMTALKEVEKTPRALMFFVGGLNSDFLKSAEEAAKKSGQLLLVAVDDDSVKEKKDQNGNPIYAMVEIPGKIYPYLEKGWIFSHETRTLAVQAVLVLRTEWAAQYGPTAMDALSLAINQSRPEIEKLVNGGAK
ncbi:MAG: TAXI family TRAP transporter solute-binding subunit [Desulfomonilaceae bacterium]